MTQDSERQGITITQPKISHEDARGIDLRVGVVWGQRVAFTGEQVSCTDLANPVLFYFISRKEFARSRLSISCEW